MQLKFLNQLSNSSQRSAFYLVCMLLTCCFIFGSSAYAEMDDHWEIPQRSQQDERQHRGDEGVVQDDDLEGDRYDDQHDDGVAMTTLDRFMQDVFEDGEPYGSYTDSYAEVKLPGELRNGDSVSDHGATLVEDDVEPRLGRVTNSTQGGKLQTLSEISKLALIEDRAALSSTFTLIGSDIVGAYKHLAIGDNARFIKAINKVIMNTDDPKLKSEGYYWIGRVRMKDGHTKKAGQSFLDGYKQGAESLFGAYNLLGLAESMWALEKRDESCAAAKQLIKMTSGESDEHIYPAQLGVRAQANVKKFCTEG